MHISSHILSAIVVCTAVSSHTQVYSAQGNAPEWDVESVLIPSVVRLDSQYYAAAGATDMPDAQFAFGLQPGWQILTITDLANYGDITSASEKNGITALVSPSRLLPATTQTYSAASTSQDIALSPLPSSARHYQSAPDNAIDNEMSALAILPKVTISQGDVFEWRARSMHYDARDSYRILAATVENPTPSDFDIIAEIENEAWIPTRHTLSLDAFTGKEVTFAIQHLTGTQGYILAIEDIHIGAFADRGIEVSQKGAHFFGGDEEAALTLGIKNFGYTPGSTSALKIDIAKVSPDGELGSEISGVETFTVEYTVPTLGEEAEISLPLALNVGESVRYTVYDSSSSLPSLPILSDYINRSAFRRTMMLEKFTGTWCNSCPAMNTPAHRYVEHLKDECLYIEAHVKNAGGGDINGYNAYTTPVQWCLGGSYPTLIFNREHKQNDSNPLNTDAYAAAMTTPCIADVKILDATIDGDVVTARVEVRVAEPIDNSADTYRIAMAVTQDEVTLRPTDYLQKNRYAGNNTPLYNEVNFLPSEFPVDLTLFHHVVRFGPEGCIGISESLPAQLVPGETYSCTWSADMSTDRDYRKLPTLLRDHLRLVASMVYFKENKGKVPNNVLNCASTSLSPSNAGISSIGHSGQTPEISRVGSRLSIAIPSSQCKIAAEVYTLQGVLVARDEAYGGLQMEVPHDTPLICRVITSQGVSIHRIL